MASNPASVMSIVRAADERGDGATGGSTRSRPPVIDLANNRLMLDFIPPSSVIAKSALYCSKFRGQPGVHLRHGYPEPSRGRPWTSNASQMLGPMIGSVPRNGGGYGGKAVGGETGDRAARGERLGRKC